VTPVIVKLQLADLGSTGSVVGRLSGTATLGAITATFLTGFVLMAHAGTTVIVTGTGALLVLAGAWPAVRPARRPRPTAATTATAVTALVALPAAPWLLVLSPNPCQVETEYHCVRIEETPAGTTGRTLWLDTLANSYVDLADPLNPGFEYVRAMAIASDAVLPEPAPVKAFYVGGGGFALPRHEATARPGSTATVVEIDPGVVDVSRRHLGAAGLPRTAVLVQDGRTAIAAQPAASYDLVVGDAFGGVAVPWHLTTRQAATGIRRSLLPGGLYVVNVIDYPPDAFARAEAATLRSVFAHVVMAAPAGVAEGRSGGNHVFIASSRPLPLARTAARLGETLPQWRLTGEDETARFAAGGTLLTDDFAPVDQLLTGRPTR
jgi:spermidine synthase